MARWKKIDNKTAQRMIENADVRVSFLVAPADQGQIVEYAYAALGDDGLLERVTDRSDRSVSYRTRGWRASDEGTPALNRRPD